MGVTKPAARPAAPPVVLPLTENLRIYLYQLADAGHLSRDQADALVAGQVLPAEVLAALQPGQVQFIQGCLVRLG